MNLYTKEGDLVKKVSKAAFITHLKSLLSRHGIEVSLEAVTVAFNAVSNGVEAEDPSPQQVQAYELIKGEIDVQSEREGLASEAAKAKGTKLSKVKAAPAP